MPLEEYKKKRDFKKTPEPLPGKVPRKGEGLIYVVQKHRASHLHYDLRLEEKGVLKSWAIPKEPPQEEGVRRLAVETEDHPLGYEEFEGIIPAGEYGAGSVEVWDRGIYRPEESSPDKRIFEIEGRKLRGHYALIRLKPKKLEDRNWLFFKRKGQL